MTNELQCKSALHDQDICKIQHMISKIERLNEKCEENMQRLNSMMLELKGIIAMVRPMAKKNDWYGEEVEVTPKVEYKISHALKNLK